MNDVKIKSGDYCKCLHCGNDGYVYGIAGSHGISAPFCQLCGKNDKLLKIEVPRTHCCRSYKKEK